MYTFQTMIINGVFKIYRQKTAFWLTIVTYSIFRLEFEEYFMGNSNKSIISQSKEHTENYKDKITIYYITCSIILRGLEYIKNEDFIKNR